MIEFVEFAKLLRMDDKDNDTSFFTFTARNKSYVTPGLYDLNLEDATWVLTSSFIIFTMQTGSFIKFRPIIRIIGASLFRANPHIFSKVLECSSLDAFQ